ncbi:TRAP transporter substrate-binding protein [Lutimaribacter sp. EGI FJ00015]|uniref:TRAP transporter substrate-binding protein n=1 Tax=Lutimaribacter degradans TaxID=2945989 RepID=A0ACC5ZTK9_9RHOB|nr:TRAP transporter substrate-binding protein [Lutimaribacter sp. EGI FJ00013]MCM2561679.1 TRAP transporter substrate-binding protein [Lutimaribacter sp. EGI FJ00013]MCO0612608.1 TRAP transporter substrate-binding protein [Lutimaribacter sp. EGI FJ00015]MCO0635267.1 TRAP transporter substrate-binding protein [Lutimaribacter sp. EGI FJ00014]
MFNRLLTAAATALILTAPALEAREMRVSSFEPEQGFYSSKVLAPWIEQVNEKLSAGNAFKLYPGSILGAPPAQAELVKAGVADVALVVPTYTPGLFPLSGVVEVPGLVESGAKGADMLNTLAEEGALDAEYADYKVIALFTTPSYRFLMADTEVRTPADLDGLKLRSPSKFGSELFGMVGASGVGIPAPQVYENLERGVVSGAVWVMDAYRTFRLNEVAPNVTNTNFIAQPMAVLMNKTAYDSLPDSDKAVIDEMSGRATAEWIASVIDETDAVNEAAFREEGEVTFIDLTDEEKSAWNAAFAGAADAWVNGQADTAAAAAALERARAIAAE